jgi:predicted metal-dependent hydrolase
MKIDYSGNVEVHAPKGITEERVRQILESNWDQIQHSIKEINGRISGEQEKVYEEGEKFLYLGTSFAIKIIHEQKLTKDHVIFKENLLEVYVGELNDERVKLAIKRFYYQECKAIVEKRIRYFQTHFKVAPRSIKISDSKTTWGTCDSNRQLTFNWRLAMAPMQVIDYVVVHEMCHMVHLNHDRSFWRLVGKIMPDYKEKEQWLALSSWKMTV